MLRLGRKFDPAERFAFESQQDAAVVRLQAIGRRRIQADLHDGPAQAVGTADERNLLRRAPVLLPRHLADGRPVE